MQRKLKRYKRLAWPGFLLNALSIIRDMMESTVGIGKGPRIHTASGGD
jgi:hypothetical protein